MSAVIDYLERENDYYGKMTAHTKDFQADLFEEMKSRIKEDDIFSNGKACHCDKNKGNGDV